MLFIHYFILLYSAQRGHPSYRHLIFKHKTQAYLLPLTLHSSNNQVFSFPCSHQSIVYILRLSSCLLRFFRVPFHLFFFFSFFIFFSFLIDPSRTTPGFYPPPPSLLHHEAPRAHMHARALPHPTPPHLTDHHTHTRSFLFTLLLPLWEPLWNQRSFHQLASYHNLSHRNTFIHLSIHSFRANRHSFLFHLQPCLPHIRTNTHFSLSLLSHQSDFLRSVGVSITRNYYYGY
jgi:hypothetical protein